MKMIMKEQTNKANNLRLGAIYINANTGTPCRLVHIVPCQGAWLESYDGQGYGDTVKFEDVHYADADEVEDFLADYRVYSASEKAPSHKEVDTNKPIVMTPFGEMENHSYSLPPVPEVLYVKGIVAEDDEYYVGHDTITAPDGNDYPIKDYS